MFWGLIMEPKRRYTQKVKLPFHISMAALDIFSADDEPTQLMLHFEERNYLLCTLQKGQAVQCPLNLNFEAGDEVVFATNGHSNVHLSGYLNEDLDKYLEEEDEEQEAEEDNKVKIETKNKKRKIEKSEIQSSNKKSKLEQLLDQPYDSDDDESFALPEEESDEEDDVDEEAEEEEEEDDEDYEEAEEEEDDDESDEDVSSLSENEEQNIKPKLNGVASKKKNKANVKELQQNEQKSPINKTPKSQGKQQKGQAPDSPQKGNKTPNKTPKGDKNKVEKTPASEGKAGSNQKRVEGGVIIQDLKVGDGTLVKPGKMVQVYYEGRLKQNNKVFDHNTKGSGFKFRLGKQEVIKGWDVGLNGMKIGGKRRITCPPNMAYGNKGSPPVIPANATLVFDVELKNVL